MEPNTRVTSSQLRFEWNACGQSSFLWKSWANFVFSSNNLRFRWNVKNWHFSPWSMWKFHCWCGKTQTFLSVSWNGDTPHHPRLPWNREAATSAWSAHATPLLSLSLMYISAEGPAQKHMLPSAAGPSILLHCNSSGLTWHLRPWSLATSRSIVTGLDLGQALLAGSNVRDSALCFSPYYLSDQTIQGNKIKNQSKTFSSNRRHHHLLLFFIWMLSFSQLCSVWTP